MFDTIKDLFDIGLYTKEDLELFENIGWITADEEAELIK